VIEHTAKPKTRRPRVGLSGKLLILTILFVMMAEVLIYVPSIATFRLGWLSDRLDAAYTAALVLDASPSGVVRDNLARSILDSVGAKAVAVKSGQSRRLLASCGTFGGAAGSCPGGVSNTLAPVTQDVDMRNVSAIQAIVEALGTLTRNDADLIRVIGPAPGGGDFVEIVVEEGPLRAAMLRRSVNILLLSLMISGITATLVYLSLHYLFVRPMRQLTMNMMAFHADPENPGRLMPVSGRRDELGLAERELATMQRHIISMLVERSRLASLGLAVSKINHDLRNLLASAQLFSDHLSGLPDPNVQRFAPKLMRAIERAIAFCESTLSYGQAREAPPVRRMVALESLVEEVRETLGLNADSMIRWITAVERGLLVDADPDQLFRLLLNLGRNAVQALESTAPNDPGRDQIRVTGRRQGTVVIIEVADTGPGVSEKARAHLFEAFQGSTRAGGTGLGLAIAAELVRAHGGDIVLIDGTIGATFRVSFPDRAVDLGMRRERARA